jgi:predicted acyltransferase
MASSVGTQQGGTRPARRGSGRARLLSLDALRGFDMFWIVGGDGIVRALSAVSDSGWARFLSVQFEHRAWEGMTFYDLIFPLFVFIVGISAVFSLTRIVREQGRPAAIRRILKRSALLFLLGVVYSSLPARGLADIRLLGVLQRIALCYLATGVLFSTVHWRGMAVAAGVLLVGYWGLMTFVAVPGHGAGDFTEGANLANYIDQQYLPLRKYDGDHDPEGLLSTLPAIATCLLGALAGGLLKSDRLGQKDKVGWLLAAAGAALLLGYLWGLQFPIIKKIWTSSYVLVAAGYSSLLLAVFYQVLEGWGWRAWAQPFAWIGRNAITLYLLYPILQFLVFAGGVADAPWAYAGLAASLLTTVLVVALAYGLDRRGLYLRL